MNYLCDDSHYTGVIWYMAVFVYMFNSKLYWNFALLCSDISTIIPMINPKKLLGRPRRKKSEKTSPNTFGVGADGAVWVDGLFWWDLLPLEIRQQIPLENDAWTNDMILWKNGPFLSGHLKFWGVYI